MLNALCRENVASLADPTRAVSLNEHTLFDPHTAAHPPPISTLGRGGASASVLVRGAIPASAADAHNVPVGDAALAEAGYSEVLEAFFRVDATAANAGVATFPPEFPSRLGKYRVRYFLQGSAVSLGTPLTLHVREVVCDLETPSDVVCGEGVECSFKLHYSLSDFEAAEKEIRIISEFHAAGAQAKPRRPLSRILRSEARSQAICRAFLRRVLAIRLSPPETAELMILELIGTRPIRRDDEAEGADAAGAGAAVGAKGGRRGSAASSAPAAAAAQAEPEPEPRVTANASSRVWAGLFMLEAIPSKWRRVATLLEALGRARHQGAGYKLALETKVGEQLQLGSDDTDAPPKLGGAAATRAELSEAAAAARAAHQHRAVSLRPPRPAPYDPKIPIESFWLPRVHRGVVSFGSALSGSGGHPLYPGIYQARAWAARLPLLHLLPLAPSCRAPVQVRMYTCDPGAKPTLDGIEQPRRKRPDGGDDDDDDDGPPLSLGSVVASRCIAVSGRIYARARVPASSAPAASWNPLRRELRIYLSASSAATAPERDALHQLVLPQLRRMLDDRCVSVTLVDLRQRLVQRVVAAVSKKPQTLFQRTSAKLGVLSRLARKARGGSTGENSEDEAAGGEEAAEDDGAETAEGEGGGDGGEPPGSQVASPQPQQQQQPSRTPSPQRRAQGSAGQSGGRGGGRGGAAAPSATPAPGFAASLRPDFSGLLREGLLELEDCRPFFVGIVGSHYDWVPPAEAWPAGMSLVAPWARQHRTRAIAAYLQARAAQEGGGFVRVSPATPPSRPAAKPPAQGRDARRGGGAQAAAPPRRELERRGAAAAPRGPVGGGPVRGAVGRLPRAPEQRARAGLPAPGPRRRRPLCAQQHARPRAHGGDRAPDAHGRRRPPAGAQRMRGDAVAGRQPSWMSPPPPHAHFSSGPPAASQAYRESGHGGAGGGGSCGRRCCKATRGPAAEAAAAAAAGARGRNGRDAQRPDGPPRQLLHDRRARRRPRGRRLCGHEPPAVRFGPRRPDWLVGCRSDARGGGGGGG